MKIQDIIFFLVFTVVVFSKKGKIAVLIGLFCIVLAIPLFGFWAFFTAERLTWYAAAFFLLAIILLLNKSPKQK